MQEKYEGHPSTEVFAKLKEIALQLCPFYGDYLEININTNGQIKQADVKFTIKKI